MTAIADWLKAAREAQTHPETGRPWSQAYLAERVTEDTGWKLYREAYVGYEKGKGMAPETLQRFIDFWSKYGVEPPDLSPPAPVASLEERAVAAAERSAAAAERQADALLSMLEAMNRRAEAAESRVSVLERLVESLMTGRPPVPSTSADDQAWAERADAESRHQRSGHPASTG